MANFKKPVKLILRANFIKFFRATYFLSSFYDSTSACMSHLFHLCHPSYTDKILLQPSLAVHFVKIYGRKNVTISLQVSLTKSSNGAMLTPLVKPRQALVANL